MPVVLVRYLKDVRMLITEAWAYPHMALVRRSPDSCCGGGGSRS
jgi:hypothetical protein